jgi:hypothetical protein
LEQNQILTYAKREYTCGMEMGPVLVGGLLGALAGAALGAYVQKIWASEPWDEDEFRERLAELEAEIEELEFRQRERRGKRESFPAAKGIQLPSRPSPIPELRGEPPEQQYLVFTSDRDFRLSRIDYVSSRGTTVISEDVEKSGNRIEVPINEKKISRVWYLLPRVNAAPTEFQFRCHLSLEGVETQSVLPAVIQQRYMRIGLARTLFRQVILNT